jgi:hypothetical protein
VDLLFSCLPSTLTQFRFGSHILDKAGRNSGRVGLKSALGGRSSAQELISTPAGLAEIPTRVRRITGRNRSGSPHRGVSLRLRTQPLNLALQLTPILRSHWATERGSNRTHVPIRNDGMRPDLAGFKMVIFETVNKSASSLAVSAPPIRSIGSASDTGSVLLFFGIARIQTGPYPIRLPLASIPPKTT